MVSATSFQQYGDRVTKAVYRGYAVRAGYRIPEPALESVGGAKTIRIGGDFLCSCIGYQIGVPIYAARWNTEYYIDGDTSGNIPPPPKVDDGVNPVA